MGEKQTDFKKPDFIYEKMDLTIRESFTDVQVDEVKKLITEQILNTTPKVIDVRSDFWFFGRYFLVLFVGRDKRTQKRPLTLPGIMKIMSLFTTTLIYGIEIAAAFLFLYIMTNSVIGQFKK